MYRNPRFVLSQELEAKQTLLDQLRVLAADDPDFFTDLLKGETNLLDLIGALDASIVETKSSSTARKPCRCLVINGRAVRITIPPLRI